MLCRHGSLSRHTLLTYHPFDEGGEEVSKNVINFKAVVFVIRGIYHVLRDMHTSPKTTTTAITIHSKGRGLDLALFGGYGYRCWDNTNYFRPHIMR